MTPSEENNKILSQVLNDKIKREMKTKFPTAEEIVNQLNTTGGK